MRGGSAARQLPRDFALFRVLAAPVIAECDRPGTDAVLAPRRRETPAIPDRLLGIRLGTFGRMKMPPPTAGADEFRGYGHRSYSFRVRCIQPLFLRSPQLSRVGGSLLQRR